jgi:hypothetical protein
VDASDPEPGETTMTTAIKATVTDTRCNCYEYRDEDGFRWESVPGSNPGAGGKVRVRVMDDSIKDRSTLGTGTYLNGEITPDPISEEERAEIVRKTMSLWF